PRWSGGERCPGRPRWEWPARSGRCRPRWWPPACSPRSSSRRSRSASPGRRAAGAWAGRGAAVASSRRRGCSTTRRRSPCRPLRLVSAELYRPLQYLSVDVDPRSLYFVHGIAYHARILPWFERYLYDPVIARVTAWGARALAVQSGSVHAYLAYLVGALVALL